MASTLVLSARLKHQVEYEPWHLAKTSSYDLLLKLGPYSSSAAVVHANTSRVLWAVDYSYDIATPVTVARAQLEMMLANHEQLQVSSYNTVKVAWAWGNALMLPESMFDLGTAAEELELVLGNPGRGQSVEFYRHPGGIVSAFYADEEAIDFLKVSFRASRVAIIHHNASIGQQLQDMSGYDGPARCAVYYEQGSAVMAVLQGKTWQLLNRYIIKAPEDLTYFTLLALRETMGSYDGVPVNLYGDLERYTEWLRPLKAQFPKADAGNLPATWGAHMASEQDMRPWFGLLTLCSCA